MATIPTFRTWDDDPNSTQRFVRASWLNKDLGDLFGFLLEPPRAYAYRSSSLTLSTGSWTLITWDTAVYDTDRIWSPTWNSSRMTVRTPGTYLINVVASFAANNTGVRQCNVTLNSNGDPSTNILLDINRAVVSGSLSARCEGTFPLEMVAGDYIQVHMQQNSGGNLGIAPGKPYTYCQMFFAGEA